MSLLRVLNIPHLLSVPWLQERVPHHHMCFPGLHATCRWQGLYATCNSTGINATCTSQDLDKGCSLLSLDDGYRTAPTSETLVPPFLLIHAGGSMHLIVFIVWGSPCECCYVLVGLLAAHLNCCHMLDSFSATNLRYCHIMDSLSAAPMRCHRLDGLPAAHLNVLLRAGPPPTRDVTTCWMASRPPTGTVATR